jgi:iturin family lipopeptide synthetase A
VEEPTEESPLLAFLFSGQSEARSGMGAEIYSECPGYASVFDRCSSILGPTGGTTLVEATYGDVEPGPLEDARVAQPALFALQAGLIALWAEWGVTPDVVAGHSLGEYAAAHATAALGLEDGIRLVGERGRLTQSLAGDGLMAVLFAEEAEVAGVVAGYEPAASVASINSPEVVVISGEADAVSEILAEFRSRGVSAKPLRISHPFHCRCIDPILDGLEAAAARTPITAPQIPFVSMMEARLLAPGEAPDAAYWRRHAREPVRFGEAVEGLAGCGCMVFLEVGPHATLTGLGERRGRDGEAWATSLRRTGHDRRVLAEAAGKLWLAGVDLDLEAMADACGYDLLRTPFSASRTGVR